MLPFLTERYGNPSGVARGWRASARRAVDEARDVVAECLGCRPGEVVFTGGGTEADNLAIFGVRAPRRRRRGVRRDRAPRRPAPGRARSAGGSSASTAPAGSTSTRWPTRSDDSVTVVSVMLANNEVGTIQPLAAVAAVVADRAPGAVLHTDAVQACAWLDVAARGGAGATWCRSAPTSSAGRRASARSSCATACALAPLLLGGGQERERRSGTHNVAGIVAMAAALRATVAERRGRDGRARRARCATGWPTGSLAGGARRRRDRRRATARSPGSATSASRASRARRCCSCSTGAGMCASAASSCASGAHGAVARARGDGRAAGAGRGARCGCRSGAPTTDADVDRALEVDPRRRRAAAR